MEYSFSMLTNIADCNALLSLAQREKAEVEFRIVSLTRHRAEIGENGGEIDHEIAAAQAEVTAYRTIVATTPEGPTKETQITKLQRAELKLRTLTKKDANYGMVSMIRVELDIARAQKENEELDAFIIEVTNKKATL